MATIPVYEKRLSQQGPVGPDPERLGASFVNLGNELGDTIHKIEHEKAVTTSSTQLTDLRVRTEQRWLEAQQNAKPGAADFTPDVLKAYDEDVAEALRNAPTGFGSGNARAMIQEGARRQREELAVRSMQFEAQQGVEHRINSLDANVDKVRTAVEMNPGSWKEVLSEQLGALSQLPMTPAMREKKSEEITGRLQTSAALGAVKQNPRAALDQIRDPNSELFSNLAPEARDKLTRYAEAGVVDAATSRIVSAYGRSQADGLQALTDLKDVPEDLQNEVRSHVNEGVNQLRVQRRQENADTITSIETAIAGDVAGRRTQQQVETLYSAGALTPLERAGYQAQIVRSQQQARTKQIDTTALQQAFTEGLPLDPSNTEHRKALDSYFATTSVGAAPGSDVWQAQAQAIAARTRMLPSAAIAWTRQAMRSPDPLLQAKAALFFGNVEATNKDAVSGFDAPTKAFAGLISSMIDGGTEPRAAALHARELMKNEDQTIVASRKKTYGDGTQGLAQGNKSALDNFIDRDFDPSVFKGNFKAQPAASDFLRGDFDAQTQRYYELTGDINVARDAAWKDLKRVYGPSKVNGESMVMPLPPEKFGVSAETVRADIAAHFSGATADVKGDVPGRVTAGNIDLAARPQVKNADGSISTVRSMSFQETKDGPEILVPTVSDDGRILTNQEAIQAYQRTGKHLGMFKDSDAATSYAIKLHEAQAAYYAPHPDAADLVLVPDSQTLLAVASAMDGQSVRPSYKLQNKAGDLVLDKDGSVLRYFLPAPQQVSALLTSARDAESAKQVEAAKQKRGIEQAVTERMASGQY